MDKLSVLCASLGNECTYLLLLPLVAWNMDMALGRKLVVLWGIGKKCMRERERKQVQENRHEASFCPSSPGALLLLLLTLVVLTNLLPVWEASCPLLFNLPILRGMVMIPDGDSGYMTVTGQSQCGFTPPHHGLALSPQSTMMMVVVVMQASIYPTT